MTPDYKEFLRVLKGETPGGPTLFEPFLSPYLTEQLIWRRGEHLWNEPNRYVDTLLSLRERTCADVVCVDMRQFADRDADTLLRAMGENRPEGVGYVALCSSERQVQAAEEAEFVCALGLFGTITAGGKRPVIRMDGSPEEALARGDAGWFCPSDGEEYWRTYQGRLSILGGLGARWVEDNAPLVIHHRCEDIFRESRGMGFAIGSGGCVSDASYLSLISLLGIYRRYR